MSRAGMWRLMYPDLFDEYRAKARGALFFGIPMEDLEREELLAACAMGWSWGKREALRNAVDDAAATFDAYLNPPPRKPSLKERFYDTMFGLGFARVGGRWIR